MKLRYQLIIAFIIIVTLPLLLYGPMIFDSIPGISDRQGAYIPDNVITDNVRQRVMDDFISGVLVMTLTSAMLIIWIYHGVMRKVSTLVDGALAIKEGDLDHPMELKGRDELSELASTMEEMRLRLKSDAQDRIASDRNQRHLVSNIAHDLKTPLTAIRGYSEGLMDGVADTDEKRMSYIATIHNKAVEMDALLNELTAYSNLDANRIPYSFVRKNAREYFDELAMELTMDLENQDIKFVYYNYADEDVFIVVDPVQMGRVFHNCIDNSIKYSFPDRELSIHLGVWPEGELLHVEIKDNGMGISKQDLPRIFERLYRGDASRTSAGGSGIGLSIVRKIVEGHGGNVSVISSEGEGTTVSISIKQFEPEEENSESNSDRRRRRGNRRA